MKTFWIIFITTVIGAVIGHLVNILLVVPDDKRFLVILGIVIFSAIVAGLTTKFGDQKNISQVKKIKQRGYKNKFKAKGNSRVEDIQMIGDENEIDIGDSQSNSGRNP